MRFAQIIEFTTDHIEQFNAELDAWQLRTEGKRIPHRAVLSKDRDDPGRYLLVVEFSTFQDAMDNSSRPETAEFASFLGSLGTTPLGFRNLDVLRQEEF
jgi:hypothetical protein